MLIAMKMEARQASPHTCEDVPSTHLACRECGQVFVIFLDSDSSSLKARIWLEATLNDEHDAGRDQHNDIYSLPEGIEGRMSTPGAFVQ
jgi:hypothetical protein